MSRGVLLDTHALIWIVSGAEMRSGAIEEVGRAIRDKQAYISAVSGWEIGLLSKKRRTGALTFDGGPAVWFERAIRQTGLKCIALDWQTAISVSSLPELDHGDPADRMLVATARQNSLTLVTRDRPLLAYAALGHLRAIAC